jgi:hypothetical protein
MGLGDRDLPAERFHLDIGGGSRPRTFDLGDDATRPRGRGLRGLFLIAQERDRRRLIALEL